MKKLILSVTIICVSIGLQAQSLKINKVDEFDGTSKKVTTSDKVATSKYKSKLTLSMASISDGEAIVYAIYVKSSYDLGCAGGRGNYLIIKLIDGETIKLEQDVSKIDCSDYNTSAFIIDQVDIETLTDVSIEKIRFKQTERYADFVVDTKKAKDVVIRNMAKLVL